MVCAYKIARFCRNSCVRVQFGSSTVEWMNEFTNNYYEQMNMNTFWMQFYLPQWIIYAHYSPSFEIWMNIFQIYPHKCAFKMPSTWRRHPIKHSRAVHFLSICVIVPKATVYNCEHLKHVEFYGKETPIAKNSKKYRRKEKGKKIATTYRSNIRTSQSSRGDSICLLNLPIKLIVTANGVLESGMEV